MNSLSSRLIRIAMALHFAESSDMDKLNRLRDAIQSGKLDKRQMQKATMMFHQLTLKMKNEAEESVAGDVKVAAASWL